MSKVKPIRKKNPIEVTPKTPTLPTPLSDAESYMLHHVVKLRDQADMNVVDYIRTILSRRDLELKDWAISLEDYKTIIPSIKPAQATAPANSSDTK